MAAKTFPNLGLKGGYAIGEAGWGDDMSANLLKLSILTQGGVIGIVADYPASPANGDIYINSTTNKIGARVEGAWTEYAPAEGWLLYDRGQDAYVTFNGSAWALLATGGGPGDEGIPDAPSDGSLYARRNGEWEGFTPGSGGGGGSDPGFLPPIAADFPIVFSPSDFVATLADKPVGLSVRCAPGVDGNRVPSFTHTVPTTDWNIVAKVKGFMPIRGQATTGGGICVKSGSNTMLALMYEGVQIVVRQYRAGLYYDGVRYSLGVQGHDQYLKIARIGTSLFFYVSGDGESWVQIWTETIANWLGTAAEAGIMAIAGNVGPSLNMICDYYKKTV